MLQGAVSDGRLPSCLDIFLTFFNGQRCQQPVDKKNVFKRATMPKNVVNSLLLVCNIWIEGENIFEFVEVFHLRGSLASAFPRTTVRMDADGSDSHWFGEMTLGLGRPIVNSRDSRIHSRINQTDYHTNDIPFHHIRTRPNLRPPMYVRVFDLQD